MTTNAKITKEIADLTGIRNVRVCIMSGVARFISKDSDLDLALQDLEPVYVCKLNHLDSKSWAREFKLSWDECFNV